MDPTAILTGGGITALAGAVVYIGRLLLDWRRDKRKGPIETTAASVNDAATANAILVQSIDSLQTENRRMARRIKHLEDEAEAKDAKIAELEQRVQGILAELAALKSHR